MLSNCHSTSHNMAGRSTDIGCDVELMRMQSCADLLGLYHENRYCPMCLHQWTEQLNLNSISSEKN